MTETMDIAEYLARGGKLTSPGNVPPRYRAELMKIMATFIDSELAGAAGFADVINDATSIAGRIAAAKIVAEKTAHAGRVLRIMGEFGADTDRYARHHPWSARLPRDAAPGAERSEHDMRLAVFNYPLAGWTDAVIMNLLMGRAVVVQLDALSRISYQPLAEAFREIAPAEAAHADLAAAGLREVLKDPRALVDVTASLAYWMPRVAVSFGEPARDRLKMLQALGLRRAAAGDQLARWREDTATVLKPFDLALPE